MRGAAAPSQAAAGSVKWRGAQLASSSAAWLLEASCIILPQQSITPASAMEMISPTWKLSSRSATWNCCMFSTLDPNRSCILHLAYLFRVGASAQCDFSGSSCAEATYWMTVWRLHHVFSATGIVVNLKRLVSLLGPGIAMDAYG